MTGAAANGAVFTRLDVRLGAFALRPVDPVADAAVLHAWVTHPRSAFWLMGDAGVPDVEHAYREIAGHPHHDAFLGLRNGRPAFLAERYDPAHVELAGRYPAVDGDVGMHFLCAPPESPRACLHGFTLAVITTVMELLFADPATRRVVVEPDVRNTGVLALNAQVGFQVESVLALPEKTAYLSTCTREQYLAARATPCTPPARAPRSEHP